MYTLPFSVNFIRCSKLIAGQYLNKCFYFNRTCKLLYLQRINCSSSAKLLQQNADVEIKKVYVPFEQLLQARRLEAKRSILVQVHSEHSCSQLREYCLRLGEVSKVIHYSLQPNMHFVIVEFKEESAAIDVLRKSTHTDNTQIIPVRSQFLWFKANDQKKKKKTNDEVQACVKFGNVTPPSYEDITSWLLTCKDISDQMTLLSKSIYLDDFGTRLRFLTALQIENTLTGIFPFIRAVPYGSSVNGFGKVGCDLDVVVNLDSQPKDVMPDSRLIFQTKTSLVNSRTQQQRYIESIADLIERYLPGCCSVKRILMARVPILKFRHEYSGLEVDVSLMNMSGVYMSELLNIFGSVDARVRPLVYTIRYWAKVVNLTNPTPGRWITNFSLTLLVLFYLQHVNVIPTLDELIKLSRTEDKRFAEDVNCTFLRDINVLLNSSINTDSLSDLLKGFFDFYALFDFDSHAISLRSGKLLPKQEYSALYIVNPLESHLNVSKNVSAEELGRMRIEICNAARYLDLELRNTEHSDSEPWGLVTMFESSHYNHKAKTVLYSAIQKKQQLNNTNRLVSVTELFSNDEVDQNSHNADEVAKQTTRNNDGEPARRTRRKR